MAFYFPPAMKGEFTCAFPSSQTSSQAADVVSNVITFRSEAEQESVIDDVPPEDVTLSLAFHCGDFLTAAIR